MKTSGCPRKAMSVVCSRRLRHLLLYERTSRVCRHIVCQRYLVSGEWDTDVFDNGRLRDHEIQFPWRCAELTQVTQVGRVTIRPPVSTAGKSHDPFLHRIAGKYLLTRFLRNSMRMSFSEDEFKDGVRIAVPRVVKLINDDVSNKELRELMSLKLLEGFCRAIECLSHERHTVNMVIEGVENITVTSYRLQFGEVPPGDEERITFLGQSLVFSNSQYAAATNSPDFRLFRDSIAVAEHLVAEGMGVFMEVAVHFTTRERFSISDSQSGVITLGSSETVTSQHCWTFESRVGVPVSSFPFAWTVGDIDGYKGTTNGSLKQ